MRAQGRFQDTVAVVTGAAQGIGEAYARALAAEGAAIVDQSSTAAYLYSGFYGLAKVGINGLTQQIVAVDGGQVFQL